MARPTKQGLEYFSFDTDFFTDIKVRKIARACGPNATSILICLLCNIYKNEGYYILWDEDLPFVIADTVGVAEGAVSEVIRKAVQVNFFDKEMCDTYHILTSSGIQKRFLAATYKRKEIALREEFLINDVNNLINDVNNSINDAPSTQSKVKESKVKKREKEKSPSPLLETSLQKCSELLKGSKEWLETITMNIRSGGIPDFNMPDLLSYLDAFFVKLANEGVTEKAPRDAMSHFARWLTIELKNEKNRTDGRRSDKQDANDYALQQLRSYYESAHSGVADGDKLF